MLYRWIKDAHDYGADVLGGDEVWAMVCGTSKKKKSSKGKAAKSSKQGLRTGLLLGDEAVGDPVWDGGGGPMCARVNCNFAPLQSPQTVVTASSRSMTTGILSQWKTNCHRYLRALAIDVCVLGKTSDVVTFVVTSCGYSNLLTAYSPRLSTIR